MAATRLGLGLGANFGVTHDGQPVGMLNAYFHWGEVEFTVKEGNRKVTYKVRIRVGAYGTHSVEVHRDGAIVVGGR